MEAIDKENKVTPTDHKLMTEKRDIVDQILCCEIKLKDEDKMKLTDDEKMAHNNAWLSHREVMDGPKKSRGKIFSLLLGQCTQVLIDKMKQDVDWGTISDSFDPIALFMLIEKLVLKQSDNQYKTACCLFYISAKMIMTNAISYECFTTSVLLYS
jgi:hypothetical protein